MAKKKYSRLTINEREIILKGLSEGKTQKEIANDLGRHPSTLSREINKIEMNKSSYSPNNGQQEACKQARKRKRKYKINTEKKLANYIEEKLKIKWSPELISAILKKLFPNQPHMHVSHETIYRYIYSTKNKLRRQELINYLKQSRKRRKPRKRAGSKGSRIRNLTPIHERPDTAEDREEPGHWEGDLVIGKDHKSAIGTLVERTTRFTIIVTFEGTPNSLAVVRGFAAALGVLPAHMKKSLTYDRGMEMAAHQYFTEITGIPVFFADAYSPWQRGTNENTNGLIRDYYPKKTDFRGIDHMKITSVASALNLRPRKVLEYYTPNQFFVWLSTNSWATASDFLVRQYALVV
jgi:IS30 family transposase